MDQINVHTMTKFLYKHLVWYQNMSTHQYKDMHTHTHTASQSYILHFAQVHLESLRAVRKQTVLSSLNISHSGRMLVVTWIEWLGSIFPAIRTHVIFCHLDDVYSKHWLRYGFFCWLTVMRSVSESSLLFYIFHLNVIVYFIKCLAKTATDSFQLICISIRKMWMPGLYDILNCK